MFKHYDPAAHLTRSKQAHRARCRKYGRDTPNDLTLGEWLEIIESQGVACYKCGRHFDDTPHKPTGRGTADNVGPPTFEHVVHCSDGGGFTKPNIHAACFNCNTKHRADHPFEVFHDGRLHSRHMRLGTAIAEAANLPDGIARITNRRTGQSFPMDHEINDGTDVRQIVSRKMTQVGLSERQLAIRAGINQQDVNRFLNGTNITVGKLLKIFRALDLEISDRKANRRKPRG